MPKIKLEKLKLILLTIIIFSVFGIVSQVEAVPNIDSVGNTDSTYTIYGIEFGDHNLDIHTLSNIINQTGIGNVPLNDDGWIFNEGGAANPVVTPDAHSGDRAIYVSDGDMCCNSALRFDYGNYIGGNKDIYVSWWTKANWLSDGQWKQFRINWQNDIQDDAPQTTLFNWTNSSDQWLVRPGPGVESDLVHNSQVLTNIQDVWYRIELIIHTSNFGIHDGSYLMGRYIPGNSYVNATNINIMSFNTEGKFYRWFLWQNYTGNGMTGFNGYLDDLYIQVGTFARVELCDSNVWTNRTHCEIQIPTSWSNNQITVKFNQGSFNNGDQAYLYVIDENGEVNENGYPITIEQSSTVRADVDQNSIINSIDAMLTLRDSLGLDMSGTNWVPGTHTGDVNCDNTTNSTDAMLILRKSLGLNMETTDWCAN